MITSPFSLFGQFNDQLQVAIIEKADSPDKLTDERARELMQAERSAGLHQVHDGQCIVVRDQLDRDVQADAMVTDQPGLLLTIRWADCQNFVVYAPEQHVIGVIHAGWKGLLAGVIPNVYQVLKAEWGIAPAETYVGAGPSLCQQCADFTDPMSELPGVDPLLISGRCVDLIGWADQQLDTIGVPAMHRERLAACTRCTPQTWWTYRGGDRQAVQEGCVNALGCMLK